MATVMLENRVETLEDLMRGLIRSGECVDRQLEETARQQKKTEQELARLSRKMREFKDEMQASKKIMDKHWGELSNKMGTLVEDLVVPSIPSIFKTLTNCSEEGIISQSVRFKQRHPLNNRHYIN